MNALLTWVGSDPSRSIIIDAPVTLLALAIFITICLCIKRTILMIRIHKLLIKKIAWNHWFVKFLFRNDIDDALNDFRFKMGMKIITSVPKETQKEVETGMEVQVPIFIKLGEKILVDTTTKEYLGRVK